MNMSVRLTLVTMLMMVVGDGLDDALVFGSTPISVADADLVVGGLSVTDLVLVSTTFRKKWQIGTSVITRTFYRVSVINMYLPDSLV